MVCQMDLYFDLPVAFVVMEQMGWLTFGMCLVFGKTFDSHQPPPDVSKKELLIPSKFLIEDSSVQV